MVTAGFAASTGLILRLLGLPFQDHSILVLIMAHSRVFWTTTDIGEAPVRGRETSPVDSEPSPGRAVVDYDWRSAARLGDRRGETDANDPFTMGRSCRSPATLPP